MSQNIRTIIIVVIITLVGVVNQLHTSGIIIPSWVDWVATLLGGIEAMLQAGTAVKLARIKRQMKYN